MDFNGYDNEASDFLQLLRVDQLRGLHGYISWLIITISIIFLY